MSAFRQFRTWAQRAPVAERAFAGVGAALVVAVLAWLLVPPSSAPTGPSSVAIGGGAAAGGGSGPGGATGAQAGAGGSAAGALAGGAAGSSSTPGASGAPGATGAAPGAGGTTAGGPGSGPSPGGAGGCVSPPGSDGGISATQIKIAVITVNLVGPAANSTFGLPPPSDQQAYFQDVIDSINASGGVACRKLVAAFFEGDPVDQSQLEQLCQSVIGQNPFFVIDLGAFYESPQIATCFPNSHIGFLSSAVTPQRILKQFYPYLFAGKQAEQLYRDTVLGLKQRGFFTASQGFGKLGVIERSCESEFPAEFRSWLLAAGLSPSQIVTHDEGCPSQFDTPSDLEQAILAFKSAGVTSVTQVQDNQDFSNFTTVAEQQGFRPRYGIADDGVVAITYGSQHPDYQNIANAIAITADRYGEEKTPGYPVSPGTARCNSIMAAHGYPPTYQAPDGIEGIACDFLWMFQAAVDHAPALQHADVATGLQAARSVDFAYPYGPNDFAGPGVTYGGQVWRTDQFLPSCTCWRVIDPTFHPAFS
ncbi:MAG TPA: hypothetical protein VFH58_10950 [Acidimicrobiales bacterium]|nr:hypothetical protein [Acidimicrobiales bacterium]